MRWIGRLTADEQGGILTEDIEPKFVLGGGLYLGTVLLSLCCDIMVGLE